MPGSITSKDHCKYHTPSPICVCERERGETVNATDSKYVSTVIQYGTVVVLYLYFEKKKRESTGTFLYSYVKKNTIKINIKECSTVISVNKVQSIDSIQR